tara:strand:- start:115 stop:531 length:417 start_codon:yes stop_codon:yes gene_type:complete
MNKLLIFLLFSIFLKSEEYIAGEYYSCELENSFQGVFRLVQRNGTYSDPYRYDPSKPSREYIYFFYSSYPAPLGYAPIVEESASEIFIKGTHFPTHAKSNKEEFFTAIINKEDLSIKITNLNYKTDTVTFKTSCKKGP